VKGKISESTASASASSFFEQPARKPDSETSTTHTGTPVQIVGAMATLNGRDYLLARELTVGGTTITVRSEHGFLRRSQLARSQRSATETTSTGGAR
jgi:hypothetical protein